MSPDQHHRRRGERWFSRDLPSLFQVLKVLQALRIASANPEETATLSMTVSPEAVAKTVY